MTKNLIAALVGIADEMKKQESFSRLAVAIDRLKTHYECEDSGTSEGARKGWETRKHGRPSVWEEVKTRTASPAFKDYRKKLDSVTAKPDVQTAVDELGGFGTFDVETGEPITCGKRSSGYQVSFCTTTTEDSNHKNYLNDGAFDSTVEEMARQTGSKPEVGVYKGGREISFYVKNKKQAYQLMRYHNQESALNWTAKNVYEEAVKNDKSMTEEKRQELFNKQFEMNPFFDNSENDV